MDDNHIDAEEEAYRERILREWEAEQDAMAQAESRLLTQWCEDVYGASDPW